MRAALVSSLTDCGFHLMNICRTLITLSLLVSLVCVCEAQNQGLRESAEQRGFFIGAAVAIRPLKDDSTYRETLRREFNIIVAENAFKWTGAHPSRTAYNFADTDALVDFARANKMRIRGHTLVWHRQIPAWLKNGTFTRDEAIAILRDHILALVGRYRGKVWAWDVVNEAIDESGAGFRTDSFWYKKIGPEYIKLAFEFAREADPRARLYYNDYSIEGTDKKSDAVYNLVRDLKTGNAH